MTYPLRSIIAKKDRLMKAFYKPVMPHYDDIMAGRVPAIEDVTDDFAYSFFVLVLLMREERIRLGIESELLALFKEISEKSPERFSQLMQIRHKVSKRFHEKGDYNQGDFTSVYFDAEQRGQLSVVFYEFAQRVAKDDVSVTLPEKFLSDAQYPITIITPGDFQRSVIKIEGNVTKNAEAMVTLNLKVGDCAIHIDWQEGSGHTRRFRVSETDLGLKVQPLERGVW